MSPPLPPPKSTGCYPVHEDCCTISQKTASSISLSLRYTHAPSDRHLGQWRDASRRALIPHSHLSCSPSPTLSYSSTLLTPPSPSIPPVPVSPVKTPIPDPFSLCSPLTMLPCVRWLQPILAFFSSALLTQGGNCPASCLCPDPHTVDCSGRGLTNLPDSIPLDVRRLLLSNNWISQIPSDFLVLYNDLVYLDLRNNSLSQIEPGTLSTSPRLVFLDLGSNNLTEIPKGTFGESRSLIKLRLGNNPHLSMVSKDAFLGLTSLRELELEQNALSSLQVGALSQLPSLRVVRLEGNPWVCNCNFASLFAWLMENRHKLPNGVEGLECSLPTDGRRVTLSQLSQESFRKCQETLTLTDLLIIIFSGISVSVAAIMASFFLASTVHCFQRWSKGSKGEDEESEE
ncbi:leucine-rich repeat-containing protein 38-like [Arapaima gigas]